jgi:hypothetical protein
MTLRRPGPRRRARGAAAWLASSLFVAFGASAADPAPVDAAWLVRELQGGGYLVFFRHTSTYREDVALEGRNVAAGTLSLADCATQRNLNERGVAEARRQAEIVAALKIPYAKPYVSRYCRARDHVKWFTSDITLDDALTPVRDAEKAKALQRMLATPPAPGTNTFFFAHGGIFWQATDYDSEEAETFVLRAGSPPKLVAAIKMRDWDALAAQRGTCCAPRTFWGGGIAPKE